MAIYKEVFERNYTVVGSPTITDDYVLSETSGSNYVKNTMALPSSFTSLDFITKYKKTTSTSNLSFILSDVSANRPLFINASDKLTFYNGGSDITGTTTLRVGSVYWLRMTLSGNTLDLYTLQDDNYTVDTLPEISAWIHEVANTSFTNNYTSKTLCLGAQPYSSSYGLHGELSLKDTHLSIDGELYWAPVVEELVDVSGSIKISKGYYSDGSNKINMPASTYNIDALTANQTLGGKNKLFAYTDSTDSVGALITSTTPTGSFKITKDLEHPVYLDPTKNYIAGGELIEPVVTPLSSQGGVEIVGDVPIADGIASGFSDTVYLEMINGGALFNSATESFEYTTRFKQNSALDSNEGLLDSGPSDNYGIRLTLNDGSVRLRVSQDGGTTYAIDVSSTNTISFGTYYSLRLTYSSTNGYTVSLKEDGSNTWEVWASSTSTVKPFYSEEQGYRLGDNVATDSYLNGSIDLSQTNLVVDGELVWEALPKLDQVSSTKALQYSEAQDTAYWIPSSETVSLDSVKAVQSVGPVNDLYLTSLTSNPTASLSFSDNGEIGGVHNKLPLKQKVYLNNDTDKILGVQEIPEEIKIAGGTTINYIITGSPTITSDSVVSGLSSSNYLSRSTGATFSPGSSAWEIKAKVTTGSSLGSEEIFIDPNYDLRGIRIGFQEHSGPKWQFLVSSGSYWINTSAYYGSYTVQPNTTYWIKAGYTGSEYYLEYSTDGSEYTRDVTYSSSSAVDSYALQIRSYSGYTWSGSVDLKETLVTIGSDVWWKPATVLNGIAVSGWSALYSDVTGFTGNTALDYTTPVIIDASSLEIPAGFGTYTVYLYYINGDIKFKPSNEKVLDKTVFTGYALTLNDGVIQSVSKKGELSAVFVQRGYGRNTRRYLFIPAANLRDGSFTTKASYGFYDMSVQGTLPPSEYLARMENVAYNSSDKTVVMDGDTFDYIGDMMFSFIG